MYALVTTPSGESKIVEGFIDFALHPHEAIRMVAYKIPEFAQVLNGIAENMGGELHSFDNDIDTLSHVFDTLITQMPDGTVNLLAVAQLEVNSDMWKYHLYVQKATAQPFYQVHVGGNI